MLLAPHRTALVLIDIWSGAGLPEGQGERSTPSDEMIDVVVRRVRDLVDCMGRAGASVMYVTTEAPAGIGLPPTGDERDRLLSRIDDSATGQHSAEPMLDALAPDAGAEVIVKRAHSAFHGTTLDDSLRRRGVDTLIIAGALTYGSVFHTAREAFVRGYRVAVVHDATIGYDRTLHEATLRMIELHIGPTLDTDGVRAALRAALDAAAF